jgi:transketolase
MEHNEELIRELEGKRAEVRENIFKIVDASLSGHTGGTMSILELVTALYFHHMKLDKDNPDWKERDRLVLSKAHCCEAIYALLPMIGYVDASNLDKYNCYASPFQGHADRWCTPGIDYSGGSLGQGLSFAAGMALAEKLEAKMKTPALLPGALARYINIYLPRYWTYCIVGDGECHEGQVWEAAMFANKFKLDNLINIVDYNKFSLDGPTEDILPIQPFTEKWESFGWWVKEIDGHNLREIIDTLDLACNLYGDGRPKCIIAHTVKGHSVPSWEAAHVHLVRGEGVTLGVKEGRQTRG